MSAVPTSLLTRLDLLWGEYIAARNKAAATGNMDDGIAAGRAWSRWLAEFCPELMKDTVHGDARSERR